MFSIILIPYHFIHCLICVQNDFGKEVVIFIIPILLISKLSLRKGGMNHRARVEAYYIAQATVL